MYPGSLSSIIDICYIKKILDTGIQRDEFIDTGSHRKISEMISFCFGHINYIQAVAVCSKSKRGFFTGELIEQCEFCMQLIEAEHDIGIDLRGPEKITTVFPGII